MVIGNTRVSIAFASLLLALCLSQASVADCLVGTRHSYAGHSVWFATSLRNPDPRHSRAQRTLKKRPLNRVRKRPTLRRPDVIYYPTPDETVNEMLRIAKIRPGDILYDLGSGDGRIPIMAARQYGIRAVGIEIDPKLVTLAREHAYQAKVTNLVRFLNADLFRTNISEASVVTLYLSNKINLLLRPKLLRELRAGTRILSHDFDMGDWRAEQTVKVPWERNLFRTIYLWRVPARGRK